MRAFGVQQKGGKPMAHVLESRIEQPYGGQDGLGAQNAPGLSRLQLGPSRVNFRGHVSISMMIDCQYISLEAGTPFIPLDADESGLPFAVFVIVFGTYPIPQ